MGAASVKTALTVKRRNRPVVENDDYAAFTGRVIHAQGRRIATGDVKGFTALLALEDELARAVSTAVAGAARLRGCGYSLGRDRRPHRNHSAGRSSTLGPLRARRGRCVVTGPEHYLEAERLLGAVEKTPDAWGEGAEHCRQELAAAQAHATLALAAATAYSAVRDH